jgi:hypothetical protein
VADVACKGVAALAAVELGQDAPAEGLIVAVVQQVDRLRGAAEVLQRACERGEVAGVAAQRSNELAGGRVALQQAARDAEQVVVVLLDEPGIDLVSREGVQRAVVGRVHTPERRAAGVREPRRVLVAEQPKQAEDHVGIAGGVRHDLTRANAGLRVQESVEDVGGVGLGAGDDDGVQTGVVKAPRIKLEALDVIGLIRGVTGPVTSPSRCAAALFGLPLSMEAVA